MKDSVLPNMLTNFNTFHVVDLLLTLLSVNFGFIYYYTNFKDCPSRD